MADSNSYGGVVKDPLDMRAELRTRGRNGGIYRMLW